VELCDIGIVSFGVTSRSRVISFPAFGVFSLSKCRVVNRQRPPQGRCGRGVWGQSSVICASATLAYTGSVLLSTTHVPKNTYENDPLWVEVETLLQGGLLKVTEM